MTSLAWSHKFPKSLQLQIRRFGRQHALATRQQIIRRTKSKLAKSFALSEIPSEHVGECMPSTFFGSKPEHELLGCEDIRLANSIKLCEHSQPCVCPIVRELPKSNALTDFQPGPAMLFWCSE